MARPSRLRDANARLKHATEWVEDFTVHLSASEIKSMVGDVEKTHVYTGSRPLAALAVTLVGCLGGFFGGLIVSSGLWGSLLTIISYFVAMPFVWLVMRRLMLKTFADAIQWLALVIWFWTFLLGMAAVAGGQITSWWLAYGISTGLGLLIGLVSGPFPPPFIKDEVWMLVSLPGAPIGSTLATYLQRNMYGGSGETAIAGAMGALAGTIYTGLLMVLLIVLWSVPQGLRQAAVIYLHNPRFARKAIDCLDRAIAESPNNADLHNLRGIAYSMAGEPDKAELEWRRVIELEPRSAEPHMNRGVDFLEQGQLDKAIESFQMALAVDPEHARVHSNMGIAYERLGQFDSAVEYYDRAIALVPDYATAYSNRAYAHVRARRPERAIEDCDRALAMNPNLSNAYVNRGHAYAALKNHEAAVDDFRAALELGGSDKVMDEARRGLTDLGEDPDD